MEKLKEIVNIKGTGIKGLTAKCLMRTNKKAIYKRSDGYFEVFYIKTSKAEEMFGKQYPDREVYPSNDDFGSTAWTYSTESVALREYKKK